MHQALELGCFHPDGVRTLLLVRHDPAPVRQLLDLSEQPALAGFQVLAPDLAQYNQLLAQEGRNGD